MRILSFIALVFLMLLPSVVYATPFSDGIAAYDRQDYKTALKLLEPLAEEGSAEAQNAIGWIKEDMRDRNGAYIMFRKAADQGNTEALKTLTLMGHLEIFPQLAEKAKGDPGLKSWLNTMYAEGRATQTYDAASECWRGMECNFHARHVIAGHDVEHYLKMLKQDVEEEKQGASISLGYLYHYGFGVERNGVEALKWYKKSRWPRADRLIGRLYFKGSAGVPQDYDEAYYWISRAERYYDTKWGAPTLAEVAPHVGPGKKFIVYMKVKGWDSRSPAPYLLVFVLGLASIVTASRIKKLPSVLRWGWILLLASLAVIASLLALMFVFPHSHDCWPCGPYGRLVQFLQAIFGMLIIIVDWAFIYKLVSRKQNFLNRKMGGFESDRVPDCRLWIVILLLNTYPLGFIASTFLDGWLRD